MRRRLLPSMLAVVAAGSLSLLAGCGGSGHGGPHYTQKQRQAALTSVKSDTLAVSKALDSWLAEHKSATFESLPTYTVLLQQKFKMDPGHSLINSSALPSREYVFCISDIKTGAWALFDSTSGGLVGWDTMPVDKGCSANHLTEVLSQPGVTPDATPGDSAGAGAGDPSKGR